MPYLDAAKFSSSSLLLLTCCRVFLLSVLSSLCIVIRLIVVFNIDPPSTRNKHESPSPNHHNRHPTLLPLSFSCHLCCLIVVVISCCPFLLSCIVNRLTVVLNIDPLLDRKQTQIPHSYSLQQTPYLDAVNFFSLLLLLLLLLYC